MPPIDPSSLRLAFAARFDLEDVERGSGTYYFMVRTLRELGHRVETFQVPGPPRPWSVRLRDRIHRRLGAGRYRADLDRLQGRRVGREATRALVGFDGDAVLTNDRHVAAFARAAAPFVLVTDTVFAAVVECGGYPRYGGLVSRNLRHGRAMEERALERVLCGFFPTPWARDAAVEEHGAEWGRLHWMRWGPNLSEVPGAARATDRRPPTRERCRLLFVGREWQRKGGPATVEILRWLRNRGVEARLTVVGCHPFDGSVPPGVEVVPYLDKSTLENRRRMVDLYLAHDLFVQPTAAEGYGIAFIESAACGLPSLGPRHTGVATAILEGESGLCLAPDAEGGEYGRKILRLIEQPERYMGLVRTSRAYHENEANWPRAMAFLADKVAGHAAQESGS